MPENQHEEVLSEVGLLEKKIFFFDKATTVVGETVVASSTGGGGRVRRGLTTGAECKRDGVLAASSEEAGVGGVAVVAAGSTRRPRSTF